MVFFVLGQSAVLVALEGGHGAMEFEVTAYHFGLRLHVAVCSFGIGLYKMSAYCGYFLVVAKGVPEVELGLVPPAMRVAVASFG